MDVGVKTCPYCAEKIKAEAIVCRHCGRELPGYSPQIKQATVEGPQKDALGLSGILVSVILPIWGIILSLIYITSQNTRERGIKMLALSSATTIVLVLIGFGLTSPSQPTTEPAAQVRPTPTRRPATKPTPTRWTVTRPTPTNVSSKVQQFGIYSSAGQGCIRWDKVTNNHIGQTVCVYGEVVSTRDVYPDFYVYFSNNFSPLSEDFRIWVIEAIYYGLEPGHCIAVEGLMRKNGSNSFFFINPASLSNEGEILVYDDPSACK